MKARNAAAMLTAVALAASAAAVSCNENPFTVALVRPLRVIFLNPADGAAGVKLDAKVTVRFSDDVVESTIKDAANFSLGKLVKDGEPAAVAGTTAWDAASKTATFTPDAALAYSTTYRIRLGTGILKANDDTPDGHLPADIMAEFTTLDPPMLGLVKVAAGSGKAPIPRDAGGGKPDSFIVSFTEPLNRDSAKLRSSSEPSGNVILENVTGKADPVNDPSNSTLAAMLEFIDTEGTTFKVTPAGLPGYGALYRLTLVAKDAPDLTGIASARATDKGGQLPACKPASGYSCAGGNYVFLFKVEGLPDLYVKYVTPGMFSVKAGDGQKYVPASSKTIAVEFSEALDCASVTLSSFAIAWDSTDPLTPGVAVSGGSVCSGSTVTFTASAAFGYSRDVLAAMSAAIRSARSAQSDPALAPPIGHLSADYPARFSTEDPKAPVVVSMIPGPVSTQVPRDTTISVGFDQPMDKASFKDSTFKVCDTTNDAACAVNICPPTRLTFNVAGDTVTCTPAAKLAWSAVEKVSLYGGQSGIKSAIATTRGGWFAPAVSPFTYTFTVVDLPPLYILATNFSGSTGFAINQQLEFIISDQVNFTDVSGPPARIFLAKSSDLSTPIPASLNEPVVCNAGSPCKIALVPSSPLDYAVQYTAIVVGGYPDGVCMPDRNAKNKDGCIPEITIPGSAKKGLYFTFTTEATPGLKVVATIPRDGDTGVPLNPTLSVQFNNQINFTTVTATSICLTKGDNASTDCTGPLAVALNAWTLKPDGKTVETFPVALLDFNENYTIVVTKDVYDKFGQTLTSYYTAAFMTMTSSLVQDIVVFNKDDLEPPNSLYIRVRFTEAMNQATISTASIYLTYKDEFGETQPVPSTVTMPDAQTAIITPDLRLINACDGGKVLVSGNDGFTDTARPSTLGSKGKVFDSSFIGRTVYIGESAKGYSGLYRVTAIDTVIPGVDQRLVLSGANFAVSEQGLDWSVTESVPALPYGTEYTLRLLTTITNAAGTKHVEASIGQNELVYKFSTGNGPQLKSVSFENGVVGPDDLFGASDVPVNSAFSAVFTSALDPAYVAQATVYLEEQRGADGAITAPATFASATAVFTAADIGKRLVVPGSLAGNSGFYTVGAVTNATTVTVTPNFAANEANVRWGLALDGSATGVITLSADGKTIGYHSTALAGGRLSYDTAYRLFLAGRTASPGAILRLLNGSPVMGVHVAPFRTSPAMTVTTNPVGNTGGTDMLFQMMDFAVMFSRDLNFASLNDDTFHANQTPVGKLTALIASNLEFRNYATLMPVPTFRPNVAATITLTKGVQDFRGNPLPADLTFTFADVGSAPATNAINLDAFSTFAPATGQISANQLFTIQFTVAQKCGDILAPSSFGKNSIRLVENPDGESPQDVPIKSRVIPGAKVVGDKVEFRPARPLKAGKPYRVTLYPINMSNMYRLAAAGTPLIYNYTGETTPPVLVAPNVTPSGTGIQPLAEITAYFSEEMDLASVDSTTFIVRLNGTSVALSGRYRQEKDVSGPWKITFTPSQPLRYDAAGYDVELTSGLKDAAGNAFAGQVFAKQFYVTNTAPKLVSGTPAGSGVAVSSPVVYTFDAAIDPATVYSPTKTAAGSLAVTWQDGCLTVRNIEGCVSMGAGGKQVVYRPATPLMLPSNTAVTADFDTAKVADLAGNLAVKNGVAPWNFTVEAANPAATCHAVTVSTGKVEVVFTDNIDNASVTALTFAVFNATTGAAVPGTAAATGARITFTATTTPLAAGDYGIMVSGVKSTGGKTLLLDYHAYFSVP